MTSKILTIFTIALACLFLNSPANAQLNLDTNFNAGVTDSDAAVYVSRPLADNKILVGGNFRFVNGTEITGLARLNSDGSLDNTFNAGGAGPNNGVYEIVQLSDGKFLIGGFFTTYNGVAKTGIVRINADGSLDSTFNSGGTGTTGTVQTITLQTDGKILISGSGLSAYNGTTRFSVIRLNADGSLDTSFTSPFTSTQFVEQTAVQADGKIIIGGAFGIGSSPIYRDVARLNTDGSLDTSFNPAGGGTDGNGVYALAIQTDGKILIGGGFQSYNSTPRSAIARLNSDGTLDTAFNPNIGAGINGGEYFVIQPDGKILVAGGFGSAGSNYSLIRLNADGSLDNTFTLSLTNSTGYHVSRQTDGKILLAGFFTQFSGQPRRNLVRLNTDGTLDSSFNVSFSTFGAVNALAQQSDGKIIAGGMFNLANGISRPNIARFNVNGTLDTSFNVGTGLSPDPGNASNVINDIVVLPNGKILAAGIFGGYNGTTRRSIIRLNSDGSLDNTFNPTMFGSLNASFIFDILVQPDGKILVGGTFIDSSSFRYLVRLNSDGSLDSGFSTDLNNSVRSIVYLPDGKLLIGGAFTTLNQISRNRIARLNNNGSLDTSFDPGTGFNGTVVEIVVQPDSKILTSGTFTTFNGVSRTRIARLNANGSLDTSFDPGTGANSTVWSISRQTDGKIIIGGLFSTYNGSNINRLARINADGSFDSSFVSGFDNDSRFSTRRLLQQADGKLVVGGTFKTYAGFLRNSLLRLNLVPQTPITNGKILFVSNRDGNQEIYSMNPDGTNQQRLTNSPENENAANWSPDGSKILYLKFISSTQSQIWIMNANGSGKTLLSDANGNAIYHGWSPDGSKILFAKKESASVENLWTMNADGSNQTQLTNAGTIDHIASWSPDGSKIAFGRCNSSFICDVFTMNADGSNQINLTPNNPNDDDGPLWTPDGGKIIFGSQNSPDDVNVYTMNANGTGRQQLTFAPTGQSCFPNKISPDGGKLSVTCRGTALTSFEIFTMNLDGSNLTNITNNSVLDLFNVWSPDSAKMAFRSRRDVPTDEIYTMNADGTGVVRLTNNSATDYATDWFRATTPPRVPFDFNGDGRTDVGIFRPAPGEWWINYSGSNQTFAVQFGSSTDRIAAGDYTGDGKADVAFFRPSDSFWYVLRSEDNSFYAFPFGSNGDVHVPADYDGDGKTDAAVFRESNLTWYIQKSSGGLDFIGFGSAGDKPVVADYDGDGKADIAITRINGANREWWIRRSSDGQVFAVSFGEANDKAVQGDYTGDGKADIAFWRPSTGFWYILRSEDNSFYAFPFGSNGDTPTPGDYDGDGRFDAAVFRSSNSVWYQQRTTEGFTAITFGVGGDIPIPSAYVP